MKKDRNCNTPYPVYPMPLGMQGMVPVQGMMPMNQGMMSTNQMIPMQGMMSTNQMTNMNLGSNMDQMSTLSNQISNLEKRVTTLEKLVGTPNYTNYNTSNFQMI